MSRFVLFALALSGATSALAQSSGDAPLLCQQHIVDADGVSIAWVNNLVDASHAPLSAELFMRTDDFEARWRLDFNQRFSIGTMTRFAPGLQIPPGAAFPVTLSVIADGRPIGTWRFTGPIVTGESASAAPGATILGSHVLVFELRDAAGALIRRSKPKLPDWDWIRREARRALAATERDRRAHRCGPSYYI